ncbi:response regulator [Hydrogenophaga sp. RAC07]|uniref:sensor histidine kinase n=1 Tax=Hydrogenophaga sp. RAC07 TaxID=1842537 RepID=UPI00083D7B0F|nr:hybrid sensor histidine kinase/response regulator [Hydrogenophaga sp. RAC07]AOF84343.1 response regulator [Hydrogenophaga sp. RAC07]
MNTSTLGPFRIAVVEDEAVQRQALIDVLQIEGYSCQGYASPIAALADPRLSDADLLITDLNLPGMSGLEMIEALRHRNRDVGAILMTGQASLQTAIDAVRIGAVDYVIKPFKLSTMLTTVSKALEQERLRREIARLQGDLKLRYDELLLINRELDAFAARISHDLRGPITTMKMVLQTLNDEALHALENDLQHLVVSGIRSGDKAIKMVHDLLEFSRLGHRELHLERLNLNEVCATVLEELRTLHPAQGCAIEVGDLPTVQGHEGLLHQVLVNLVGNAIKYSGTVKSPHVRVASVPGDTKGWVCVTVSDNGVGFQANKIHELFKPFQRLHHPDQFPGEGMGLANVKRIVERHGGTVAASLNPGGGACFKLTLPAADAS